MAVRRHGSKDIVLTMPLGGVGRMPAAVCVAARGAKQSGRTGWSASDGGRGRCAGPILTRSRETDRENGYENSIANF